MIVDDAFANAVLDALAGTGKAAGLPATMWVALYDDDPSDGGLEVTGGGYARIGSINMASGTIWPAAAGREKANATQIAGPILTGPLDSEATWAAFVNTASGAVTLTGYAQQLPTPIAGAAGQFLVLDPGDVTIPITDIGGF